MRKYNSFLCQVAETLCIKKGLMESEESFKRRVIYSAIGKIAYASLFDKVEESEYITVLHFKNRIKKLVRAYKDMYPEIMTEVYSDEIVEMVCDGIYSIYLSSGYIYHTPYRIAAAKESRCKYGKTLFTRGNQLADKVRMSGLGMYFLAASESYIEIDAISNYTNIPSQSLVERWNSIVDDAKWHYLLGDELKFEYLRCENFSKGYWGDNAMTDGTVSIMRTVSQAEHSYYLYRYNDNGCEVSQLPNWMTENGEYRNISNSCLAFSENLPGILYYNDGEVCYAKLQYLLPNPEKNLYFLYGWPTSFSSIQSSFSERTFTASVFNDIKNFFERLGYCFFEVKDYGEWSKLSTSKVKIRT